VPGLQVAARTVLATEAGGDLYEFLVDEEGALWVAAGDVAGHGYSCGIQGAMVKACLLTLVKAGRRPAEILVEVDRVLRAAKSGRLFTSLVLARIDPATGRGVLANAGHPYPLLVVEGRVRELTASGLPLGKGPARDYVETEFELPGAASLTFASDGLFEGLDRFDEPYGYERPRSVLERVGLWRRPAESILEALLGDWRTHVGEGEPDDDTSVVVVRRTIWS
jgi:serine phosphatase RsbU (regulator of sigma subunit)